MIFVNHRSLLSSCLVRGRTGLLALSALAAGCSEPTTSPNLASNTNWLTACGTDVDCGGALSCHCGACSGRCSSDADCRDYGGASCVMGTEQAAAALCDGTVSWSGQGVCLPRCAPGGCDAAQFCALGICVPVVLPSTQFCSTAASSNSESRRFEEGLISAVEQARSSGGIDCGVGATSPALPLVRFDSKLTCAARVLARDMASTRTRGITDSEGRSTQDRLTLAGYRQSYWAEGFAWDVEDASMALQVMLEDGTFCTAFVETALTDLGVGYSDGVFVVTLAAE